MMEHRMAGDSSKTALIFEGADLVFRSTMDAMYLCDCCRAKFHGIAQRRSVPAVATPKITFRDREARRITYFIGGDDGPIKIGYSVSPVTRLKEIQIGHPKPIRILATRKGNVEREYHERFADHRVAGEWFERHPEILAEITRLQVPA